MFDPVFSRLNRKVSVYGEVVDLGWNISLLNEQVEFKMEKLTAYANFGARGTCLNKTILSAWIMN